MVFFCFTMPTGAQAQKPDIPDPVKFPYKFDQVANMTRAVLEDMGLSIELDNRSEGKITTRPYDFITGSLTASEVDKVAIKKESLTGNWLKARYSAEAVIEIVSPTETMVTISANIEGLRRDVDGTENWFPMESLGVFERRILGKISVKLLGTESPVAPRKGFWGQRPQPVNPRQKAPGPVR